MSNSNHLLGFSKHKRMRRWSEAAGRYFPPVPCSCPSCKSLKHQYYLYFHPLSFEASLWIFFFGEPPKSLALLPLNHISPPSSWTDADEPRASVSICPLGFASCLILFFHSSEFWKKAWGWFISPVLQVENKGISSMSNKKKTASIWCYCILFPSRSQPSFWNTF